MDKYLKRRQRLQEKMQEMGISTFLVQSPANRFYLSGFELFDPQCNESSGYLLVTPAETILMTDPRYLEAGKEFFPADDIFIYTREKFKQIAEFLKKKAVKNIWFEPQWMSCVFFEKISREFDLTPVKGLVEEFRLIKDADEIQALRDSCALNHQAFKMVEQILEPGLTETEIAWKAEVFFREQGASGLSFSTIVASGPRAALPHAIPRNEPIRENMPVLVDMGCRYDDYCSDQTRTFWVGDRADDIFLRTRDLVLEAQELAIKKIEPGVPIKDAYNLVRSFFEGKGVFAHFTHALGHGIGLETHEHPSLGPNTEGSFEPGMVFSVEPGLYYPEWGGVRWEYMVIVGEHGAEVL